MRRILFLACFSVTLGACTAVQTGVDTAKAWVYSKGADQLNNYCDVRDETIATGLVSRVNTGLTDAGFAGTVDIKVNCP